MKSLRLKIPIPQALWKKDEKVQDKKFPKGEYILTFRIPVAGEIAEVLIKSMIGKEIPYGDSAIVILNAEYEDDLLKVTLLSTPVPLMVIVGIIASALGLTAGAIFLTKLERVIYISYPLLLAGIGLLFYKDIKGIVK
ncbi:MAG: hypothetical protein ACTSVV_14420 [Promethearchaeota archaeon]